MSVLGRRHAAVFFLRASLLACDDIDYQAFKLISNELKIIKEANKSIGLLLQKRNSLHFFLYLKLPIDAYQVYIIFEGTEY